MRREAGFPSGAADGPRVSAGQGAVGAERGEGEDGGGFGVGGCEEGQGWVRDGLPCSFVEVGLEWWEREYLRHCGILKVSQRKELGREKEKRMKWEREILWWKVMMVLR